MLSTFQIPAYGTTFVNRSYRDQADSGIWEIPVTENSLQFKFEIIILIVGQ